MQIYYKTREAARKFGEVLEGAAMTLPELKTRIIESDPYRSVVIYEGCLIFAECNGSQKQEVADEIVKRCNAYPKLLQLISDARDELVQLSCSDARRIAVQLGIEMKTCY